MSQTSHAQDQEPFRNDTISWGDAPLIFSKRTTCSGTCAECYGTGSILCGTNDACFNPTIGESCCSQYSYSCPDGYYCAPDGLDMQCCGNSISTTQCTNSINNGGGTSGGGSSSGSGGLSTGAKAGIGIGVVLLLAIIAGLAAWFCLRRRIRRRITPAAPATWQMPDLAGGPGGPGGPQPSYNSAQAGYDNTPQTHYNNPQAGYNGAQPGYNGSQGVYNGAQGGYDNAQGGYGSSYGHPDTKNQQHVSAGGPPVADVYTPGDGPQRGEYHGYVPSHVELPESPPVQHAANPAMTPQNYPAPTEHERARAAEMYGGYGGQNY